MKTATFTISEDKRTLHMEREFSASAERLWEAYADPTILAQWFSPRGWVTDVQSHSFVNGGEFFYIMRCVDEAQDWFGQTSSGKMVFDNINPKTSFEYRDVFTDDAGTVNESLPASHSFVTISAAGPGSSVLRVVTTYATAEALQTVLEMGMEEGYAQTLDKLEELLA